MSKCGCINMRKIIFGKIPGKQMPKSVTATSLETHKPIKIIHILRERNAILNFNTRNFWPFSQFWRATFHCTIFFCKSGQFVPKTKKYPTFFYTSVLPISKYCDTAKIPSHLHISILLSKNNNFSVCKETLQKEQTQKKLTVLQAEAVLSNPTQVLGFCQSAQYDCHSDNWNSKKKLKTKLQKQIIIHYH